MIRRVVYLLLVVLILASQPAYACPMEVYTEYYSDYFVTAVGWWMSDCDCYSTSGGQQDGAYMFQQRTGCAWGTVNGFCYEKVNGAWQQISCP